MSEANTLTQQVISFIFRAGGFAWRASSTGIYDQRFNIYRTAPKKGVSDILACYQGRLIAIEVKIGKDRMSPEQIGFQKSVRNSGAIAFTIDSFDTFQKEWYESIEKYLLVPIPQGHN